MGCTVCVDNNKRVLCAYKIKNINMKKYFSLITILCAFLSLTTSCNNKKITPNGGESNKVGKLKLTVAKDKADYEVAVVKSSPIVADFKVIIKDVDGVEVMSWDKASDIDEIVGLKVGNYTVEANSGAMAAADWDTPHYGGTQSFLVAPENITAVNLVCYIDNAKVTLKYTDEFKAYFGDDYKIDLVNDLNSASPLTFTSTESRSAFVKPGRTELRFSSIKAPSNVKVLENVKAREHHILTFGVKETGDAIFDIKVDVTTNDINMDLEVPTDEEDLGNGGDMPNPDPTPDPDPEPDPDPTPSSVFIVGDGFNIDENLVLTDGIEIIDMQCKVPVKVNLTAENGIKELIVDIISPDLTEELLNSALGAKRFDMANPTPEVKANLITFGILAEDAVVKGAKSYVFDITGFMGIIPANVIPHKFEITLVDENNNTITKTLSILRK